MDDAELLTEDEVAQWFDEEENEESNDAAEGSFVDPATKYSRSQLRVVRESKDYQLDYLRHALAPERTLIDTSPIYQRRLRWSKKKRSLLIESFLLNIPVPPVFLYEHDYNEYEVIDGRQRLDTIRDFLANAFALGGLEFWPELNGKRFNKLPPVLQKGLLRRSLSAVVLLAETRDADEDDLDVRRVLFDRLNTGGTKLNPQELRNALYPGPLNALLIDMARTDLFTKTWAIPPQTDDEATNPPDKLLANTLFKSMADAELVLRFFALKDAIDYGKKGSLRRILDRYMESNSKAGEEKLILMREEFAHNLRRLFEAFDGEPFRLPTTGRPSRPLYDALMIAASRNPDLELGANSASLQRTVKTALHDADKYEILVGRGNTIDSIRKRVALAEELLKTAAG